MSGFIGCGTVYINRQNADGTYDGFKKVGNATKLAIKTSSTLKERKSKACGSFGQTVDSVSIPDSTELTMSLDDLDANNLAIAFLGTNSALNNSAGSVLSEVVIAGAFGASVQLAGRNISNVVVKDQSDTTTFVAGTDYNVILESAGLVEIIEGGAITPKDSLLVSYDTAAETGATILGGTNSRITAQVLMVGKNLADNKGVRVNVWDAVLSPSSEVDFLADDFSALELQGRVQLDADRGNGFEVEYELTSS